MASGLQEAAMTLSPLTDMTADDDDNDDDDRRGRRNRKDDSWSSRLFRSLSRAPRERERERSESRRGHRDKGSIAGRRHVGGHAVHENSNKKVHGVADDNGHNNVNGHKENCYNNINVGLAGLRPASCGRSGSAKLRDERGRSRAHLQRSHAPRRARSLPRAPPRALSPIHRSSCNPATLGENGPIDGDDHSPSPMMHSSPAPQHIQDNESVKITLPRQMLFLISL